MLGWKPSLVAVLALLIAAPAQAADKEAAKKLVADLTALRKANDATGFQGELKGVVTMHNALEDKGLKSKLQKELGAALKDKKLADAHKVIVKALSELDDAKGAFKQLKKHLPNPKKEEVPEIQLDALRAVAVLAPDGALKQLLDIAEKAKHRPSAIEAINALGHYGKSKKRVMVLEEMVKLVMRFMPPKNVQAGEETIKRWNDLWPPLANGLNRLTGQKIGDPDEWIQMWRDNKKKPDNLFMDE